MKSDGKKESGLDVEKLPAHVAIIMDGNGRWAKKRLMNRVRGHEKGSDTVRSIVTSARELGIGTLTLYAFSTENWTRPKAEVKTLMLLLKRFMKSERDDLRDQDICLNILGQKHKLPLDVQKEADKTIQLTRNNQGMVLNLALSYGSRQEITQAMKTLAWKIKSNEIQPDEITEEMVSGHLYTAQMPDPDLIIRTSGEFRLSNFMMWQAAYSELYITDTLWPDFTKEEFVEILINFQKRDRRFGKVKCSTSNDGSPQ
ncbi:MAG: isoprenyl transferase [Desulfobacula sp.]|nr:isoprenyl transferase [Desulfobacula sp.]